MSNILGSSFDYICAYLGHSNLCNQFGYPASANLSEDRRVAAVD